MPGDIPRRFSPLTRWGLWVAYLSPICGLVTLAALDRLLFVHFWPRPEADGITIGLALILTLAYSHAFLQRIRVQYGELTRLLDTTRRQRDRLRLLHEAMISIAEQRGWEEILAGVVDVSRQVTGARYGALAVLRPDETIARFITSGMSADEIRAIGSLPRGKGLLGEVIHTRRPLRVADIQNHPASSGWPAHHPVMHSFLGMPVLFREQVVGHLYLTDKEQGTFTSDDEEIVGLLASQAAALITNARLNQELERLAVVEERQRIGMDLHDGTIQGLYGVMLEVDGLLAKLPDATPVVRATLDHLGDRLARITDDIRHYIFDLHQDTVDWPRAVADIIDDLALTTVARVHTGDELYRHLAPSQLNVILSWTREAVSNAARHAHARRIDITWRGEGPRFRITVEDDGVGFDPDHVKVPGHFGLQHLSQRARELGGTFNVHSRKGQGTRVELLAPFIRDDEGHSV